MSENRTYPIYRQLAGGGHLYRIDSEVDFTELQRIGSRWVMHRVKAVAYPEMVRIHEMVQGADGSYLELSETEWEAIEALVAS
jgi:hypothetical protein